MAEEEIINKIDWKEEFNKLSQFLTREQSNQKGATIVLLVLSILFLFVFPVLLLLTIPALLFSVFKMKRTGKSSCVVYLLQTEEKELWEINEHSGKFVWNNSYTLEKEMERLRCQYFINSSVAACYQLTNQGLIREVAEEKLKRVKVNFSIYEDLLVGDSFIVVLSNTNLLMAYGKRDGLSPVSETLLSTEYKTATGISQANLQLQTEHSMGRKDTDYQYVRKA